MKAKAAAFALVLFCLALIPRSPPAAWREIPWPQGLRPGLGAWFREAGLERETRGLPAAGGVARPGGDGGIAGLEDARPGLDLSFYLVNAVVKSSACGPGEFTTMELAGGMLVGI